MSAFDFVPGAWRKPIGLDDFLVEVWRFHHAGRDDDARTLLAEIWSQAMDGGASEKEARVALRLLDRLGFVTDDPEGWTASPSELIIYRAENGFDEPAGRGLCWTLLVDVAERHAKRYDLSISRGRVSKCDVLAYITQYGEEEIVVRREHVRAQT